jgi:thiol-disulfide isomerase/thioredoxin
MISRTLFVFNFLILATSTIVVQKTTISASPINIQILQREGGKIKQSGDLFADTIPQTTVEIKDSLTHEFFFLPDSIKTFKQLLSVFKGQTVLLDMWGTWCSPCRKEIYNNSAALKKHFAGKDVRFLYVANHDLDKDKAWKELIAFYQLNGYHLLATTSMTYDIMKQIRSQEYPTYVVIDKYGNFEKSRAGYPMKRDVLIKQIEEALKK